MSVRNTSEEGVVRRENLAGGGLEEITGKEDWIGKYILTEILNPRTLHPLCQFSSPQGTHREGYLAKAE